MIGVTGLIFAFIPESPWWLASKGKIEKASKVLHMCNGRVRGYDVDEQIVSFSLGPNLTAWLLVLATRADSIAGSHDSYHRTGTPEC